MKRRIHRSNEIIIPHTIVFRGRAFDIDWIHAMYHIRGYCIITNKNNLIQGIKLLNCFHPNAIEEDKKSINVRYLQEKYRPDEVYLCTPREMLNKELHKDFNVDDVRVLIGTWNFNDCFFRPPKHHYKSKI